MHRLIAPAFFALATPALADQTILVLDGSGSMWGQIEGKAKITIAQEVVGDLLAALPDETELGLTVYGHRRKGDCSDIETLVRPGPDTRAAIADAVNAVSPKGKTPMTDAVTAAAEALRYTEEPATVVLVTDGIETCAPDPCAAARALEAAGVQFTAHVVGFDVDDPEALRQMQCLASETGGSFRAADDADGLADALDAVTQAAPAPEPDPQPEPEPEVIEEVALTGPQSVGAGEAVAYTIDGPGADNDFLAIYDASGEMIDYKTRANGDVITLQMPQTVGVYELRVLSQGRETAVMARLAVEVTELVPELDAPASVTAGSSFDVRWTGPGTEWDFLSIATPGEGGYVTASDYLTTANPIAITAPDTPGTYELRYIYGDQREVIVRQELVVE